MSDLRRMSELSPLAKRWSDVKAALPPHVTLVAVSKMRSPEEIKALYDLGQRDFGENYAQELRAKQPVLPQDIRWHFIGHLQRGNVRHIVPFVHLIQSVDGATLLDEIEKRASALGRVVEVLLQVRIAREETKHGLLPDEAVALVRGWSRERWPSIRLRGLMGMATLTGDAEQVREEFSGLGELFRSLRPSAPDPAGFEVLSMGMSGDLDLALQEGSNLARVGTAIFGERH